MPSQVRIMSTGFTPRMIARVMAIGLCLLGPAASAESVSWSITPYIWASDTSIDLAFRDQAIGSGELSFDDLLDVLDAAFMVHVEGGKGQWSAFADLTYLDTSDTTQRTLLTVDARNKQTFLDAAIAYWPGGSGSPLSLFGGLRYSGFDDRYSFSRDGTVLSERRSRKDYYDVLLGARYAFKLSERWSLLTHADYSFGDSEGTYLLRANFGFRVGARRQNQILFGYQYKQAEFKDGDLTSAFAYTGPMAGFNFRF